MKRVLLIAGAVLLTAAPAMADVVTDWNIRTGQAIGAGARRGPSGVFDFAMVHLAVHDAVQAYERRYETYCATIPDPAGSPIAAAATAAHHVLVALFPAQQGALDLTYSESLTKYNVVDDPGIATGALAAACVLERLAADNAARAVPDSFVGSHEAGAWRPTSLNSTGGEVPIAAQFIATFKPFALKTPDQMLAAQPPPPLTSGAYAKAYEEVKVLGARVNHGRTIEQTKIALFFSDGPPTYWNGASRNLVAARALSLGDSARLFALLNMSLADAAITAWNSKIGWNFWRPVTAIREGQFDGNPNTEGDATWQSFANTPNYPDYTSGATNLAGAAGTTLANVFGGDDVTFSLMSGTIAAPDNVRNYVRCSDAIRDVVDARIYMGIHFRFADSVGAHQGAQVANWAFGHYLRPLSEIEQ